MENKVIMGALSAAAVIIGYLAYRNVKPNSRASRQSTRKHRVTGKTTTAASNSLAELETVQKLFKKATRATHAKDLVTCVDLLDEIIDKFQGNFEAFLLRARCAVYARELCKGKPSEEEDVKRMLERVEKLDRDADLLMAKKMADNEAQRVIIDVESKIGHLDEKDLSMDVLEENLAAVDAVVNADEEWAQYDMLLLERINLYVGCITKFSQQMESADNEEKQRELQGRMVEYIVKVTRDCDKIVECSKNDEFLADAYYYRATFMEMGSPDQLVCISKSITKLPEFVDALVMRAQVYFSAFEDIPHALSDFERVLKLEPTNTDALFFKAACLLKQGVTKKPSAVSEEERTASGENVPPSTAGETSGAPTVGTTDLTAGAAKPQASSDEVLALLERVLQLQPDYFDAAATLCNLLQDRGEVHKAPDVIRKQIELLEPRTPQATMLDMHLLLAEYLLSAQQFDECAQICAEQVMQIEEMKPTSEEARRIELTQKNFNALKKFALSVRDNMSLFPTLDAKFAGKRAPFMENMVQKDLRELVLKEEDESEEKTIEKFIDCLIFLFVAGTERVSLYQGLERFKELISQEGKKGVVKACRNGFFLTQFFSDYVMRGEEGNCFICDTNFVATLEQLLQADKEGKEDFYESLDKFLIQIITIAEQRRRQQQMMQQQQILAAVQQQQQQQQQ